MEKLIQDGVLGIVTGIVTAGLLFLLKAIWDAKLRPFLNELRYQGVDIAGKWVGRGADEKTSASSEFTLFLTQSAQSLAGTYRLKHQSPTNSFDLNFNVVGRIWEGYIILNLTPIDRRVTSYATSLLKIAGGGVTLEGQICFRNVNEERVVTEPLILARGAAIA